MRRPITTLTLTIALCSSALAIEPVNIVGDWLCEETEYAGPDGLGVSDYTFKFAVTEQKGAAFRGHVDWIEDKAEVPEEKMTIRTVVSEENGAITFRAPIFGIFALGDGRFSFSEKGDPGFHIGSVIDEDTIEFVYLESGEHAFAAGRICSRIN